MAPSSERRLLRPSAEARVQLDCVELLCVAADQMRSTLCHDDLQHTNLIFQGGRGSWKLAAVLDWDKAWAGPPESDVARMAFWDDMTGDGFWEVYNAGVPPAEGRADRALIYQLLWCLEYPVSTPRHRADTASLCRRPGSQSEPGWIAGLAVGGHVSFRAWTVSR